MQKDLFMCFIDYQNAFDTMRHVDLLEILNRLDIGKKDLRVILCLYYEQTAAVRVGDELMDWVNIKRGVRQGCVMSPVLFSLYGEIIMRNISDKEGIRVGGQNTNNIRYADDTVLIVDSEEKLQRLIDEADAAEGELGLKINRSKAECMVLSKRTAPTCELKIGNEHIKQFDRFMYLGSTITEDGRSESDIKQRIGLARRVFGKMKNVNSSMHLKMATRMRVIKTYIWSLLLYRCEARTLNAAMENQLKAFEIWCWRRILGISWVERKTNESILEEIGKKIELLRMIRRRQLGFLGHILRSDALENLSQTGKIAGSRGRGRPRIKYMDGIKNTIPGGRSTVEY